jgi:two-component system cell cycle sensor histidine kinase/response regulator CckA
MVIVELRLAPGLPAVHADGGMLEQVLMNLAVNARDAMPRGGRITITTAERIVDETEAAQVREARTGNFVAFRFSDTGTGMTPEILAHIFEPFFTTKDVGKGTGLGLATVYGIIKQHQGWIEVETSPGAGTAFTILLPALAPSKEAEKPVASRDDWARGTETVLLVEDEEPLRQLGIEVLGHAGYTVHAAANGHEALQLWRKHRPQINLLLTDNMMPGGLLGHEVAQRILQDEPALPVLFTSGDRLPASKVAAPGALQAFLQKPYTPASLALAVRQCLDRRAATPLRKPISSEGKS